jgi:hypothetical protein
MHEMVVTSGRSKMDPSGIAQLSDDRPAVHRSDDVYPRDERQAACNAQVRS